MSLIEKFSDVVVDNSRRLSPEDMEFCKQEEQAFRNGYDAYMTAYKSVKEAYERQDSKHDGYIWDYCECGVYELQDYEH